jgi:hypothetical protein
MRIVSIGLLAALALISCAFSLQAKPLEDRGVAAKLTGTWIIRPDDYASTMRGGICTFRRDGTYLAQGSVKFRDHYVTGEGQGNWRIVKGVLIEDVTKSSVPEIVPIGRTYHHILLAVTDEGCWIREEDGTEHIWTRFKPQN